MNNIPREIAIGQILLDLNILPHELNCLIIEYQKTIKGDLIQKIDLKNFINQMVVDDENIYTVDNAKVSIYGKYNGILTTDFGIMDVDDDLCENTHLAIDDDNIYVATNSGKTNKIKVFNKNGKFIKDTTKYSKIDALVADKEYIYVSNEDIIFKYAKKDLELPKSQYIDVIGNHVLNITVDDKYVYSQNINLAGMLRNILILTVYDKNSTNTVNDKEKIEVMKNCLVCQNGRKLYIYSLSDNTIKIINIENNKTEKLHIYNKGLLDLNEYAIYLTIDSEFIYIATQKKIHIYAQ